MFAANAASTTMNGGWRTIARSDQGGRLLGPSIHSFSSHHEESPDELREEDMWTYDSSASDQEPKPATTQTPSGYSNGRVVHSTGIRRKLMRSELSQAFKSTSSRSVPQHHQQNGDQNGARSAPVNVPDWRNLGFNDTKESQMLFENENEDEDEKLPPHEYLAREHASSQSTTKSVLQGVGRTLKGRDMSRVRNTVWRQTGFFG